MTDDEQHTDQGEVETADLPDYNSQEFHLLLRKTMKQAYDENSKSDEVVAVPILSDKKYPAFDGNDVGAYLQKLIDDAPNEDMRSRAELTMKLAKMNDWIPGADPVGKDERDKLFDELNGSEDGADLNALGYTILNRAGIRDRGYLEHGFDEPEAEGLEWSPDKVKDMDCRWPQYSSSDWQVGVNSETNQPQTRDRNEMRLRFYYRATQLFTDATTSKTPSPCAYLNLGDMLVNGTYTVYDEASGQYTQKQNLKEAYGNYVRFLNMTDDSVMSKTYKSARDKASRMLMSISAADHASVPSDQTAALRDIRSTLTSSSHEQQIESRRILEHSKISEMPVKKDKFSIPSSVKPSQRLTYALVDDYMNDHAVENAVKYDQTLMDRLLGKEKTRYRGKIPPLKKATFDETMRRVDYAIRQFDMKYLEEGETFQDKIYKDTVKALAAQGLTDDFKQSDGTVVHSIPNRFQGPVIFAMDQGMAHMSQDKREGYAEERINEDLNPEREVKSPSVKDLFDGSITDEEYTTIPVLGDVMLGFTDNMIFQNPERFYRDPLAYIMGALIRRSLEHNSGDYEISADGITLKPNWSNNDPKNEFYEFPDDPLEYAGDKLPAWTSLLDVHWMHPYVLNPLRVGCIQAILKIAYPGVIGDYDQGSETDVIREVTPYLLALDFMDYLESLNPDRTQGADIVSKYCQVLGSDDVNEESVKRALITGQMAWFTDGGVLTINDETPMGPDVFVRMLDKLSSFPSRGRDGIIDWSGNPYASLLLSKINCLNISWGRYFSMCEDYLSKEALLTLDSDTKEGRIDTGAGGTENSEEIERIQDDADYNAYNKEEVEDAVNRKVMQRKFAIRADRMAKLGYNLYGLKRHGHTADLGRAVMYFIQARQHALSNRDFWRASDLYRPKADGSATPVRMAEMSCALMKAEKNLRLRAEGAARYRIRNVFSSLNRQIDGLLKSLDTSIHSVEGDRRRFILFSNKLMSEYKGAGGLSNYGIKFRKDGTGVFEDGNVYGIGLKIMCEKYLVDGGRLTTVNNIRYAIQRDLDKLVGETEGSVIRGEDDSNALSIRDVDESDMTREEKEEKKQEIREQRKEKARIYKVTKKYRYLVDLARHTFGGEQFDRYTSGLKIKEKVVIAASSIQVGMDVLRAAAVPTSTFVMRVNTRAETAKNENDEPLVGADGSVMTRIVKYADVTDDEMDLDWATLRAVSTCATIYKQIESAEDTIDTFQLDFDQSVEEQEEALKDIFEEEGPEAYIECRDALLNHEFYVEEVKEQMGDLLTDIRFLHSAAVLTSELMSYIDEAVKSGLRADEGLDLSQAPGPWSSEITGELIAREHKPTIQSWIGDLYLQLYDQFSKDAINDVDEEVKKIPGFVADINMNRIAFMESLRSCTYGLRSMCIRIFDSCAKDLAEKYKKYSRYESSGTAEYQCIMDIVVLMYLQDHCRAGGRLSYVNEGDDAFENYLLGLADETIIEYARDLYNTLINDCRDRLDVVSKEQAINDVQNNRPVVLSRVR